MVLRSEWESKSPVMCVFLAEGLPWCWSVANDRGRNGAWRGEIADANSNQDDNGNRRALTDIYII